MRALPNRPAIAFPELAGTRALAAALRRSAFEAMLVAAVLIGGYEAYLALESPGAVIRRDLMRAGSEVAQLRWLAPKESVQQRISRHFGTYQASVDATHFPLYVKVTLSKLNRKACRDAYRFARRIDGRVVIVMEGPADQTCKEGTALTWRIMP